MNQATDLPKFNLPSDNILTQRKSLIQTLYQENHENEKYPLVTNPSQLDSLPLEDIATSYLDLWTLYNKAGMNPKVQVCQLNCRLFDLCCRAHKLYQEYIQYVIREPLNVSKLPFHVWIHTLAKSDNEDAVDGGYRAFSGKKSTKNSLPLDSKNRSRILDLVNNHGHSVLVLQDMVNLAKIGSMKNATYTALNELLLANKDAITTAAKSINIDEAFPTTASNATTTTH
ncbi:uncharacterized protein BX664DRAFT_360225, partial [Halteromyces radiatus]|uniref:uncharacterized protein n=1 Tax=Halteromyces radiatus TaxID=101107 RepID=UPI0022210B47